MKINLKYRLFELSDKIFNIFKDEILKNKVNNLKYVYDINNLF